jgi:hypothetical protein
MRIFVTGATRYMGSAIVQESRVHRGSLEDLESLRSGAADERWPGSRSRGWNVFRNRKDLGGSAELSVSQFIDARQGQRTKEPGND